MINHNPSSGDIRVASRTTSGLIVTIPAGRTFSADVSLSASIAVAGSGNPFVTFNGGGQGAEPASGTVVSRLALSGLALAVVANSTETEIIVRAGDADATLDFNVGGTSSAAVSINGFLI